MNNSIRKFYPVRRLARTALIAAIYVALCFVFSPISFGPVQIRVSEALTLLPILCPEAVVGVTVGCFLSNMLLSAPIDMLVGTAATLLAALATRKLKNVRWHGLPLLASLPPVLFNAVIVGIELSFLYFYPPTAGIFAMNIVSVGAGQLVSCCILGVILIWIIERNSVLLRFFKGEPSLT